MFLPVPPSHLGHVIPLISVATVPNPPSVELAVDLTPKRVVVRAPGLPVVESPSDATIVLSPLAAVQVPVVLGPVLSLDGVGAGASAGGASLRKLPNSRCASLGRWFHCWLLSFT